MQVMNDEHDAAERNQDKMKQELAKMSAWGDQIAGIVAALAVLSEYFDEFAASRPPGLGVRLPEQRLRQLSDHFHEVHPVSHGCVFGFLACSQACVLIGCIVLSFDVLALALNFICSIV